MVRKARARAAIRHSAGNSRRRSGRPLRGRRKRREPTGSGLLERILPLGGGMLRHPAPSIASADRVPLFCFVFFFSRPRGFFAERPTTSSERRASWRRDLLVPAARVVTSRPHLCHRVGTSCLPRNQIPLGTLPSFFFAGLPSRKKSDVLHQRRKLWHRPGISLARSPRLAVVRHCYDCWFFVRAARLPTPKTATVSHRASWVKPDSSRRVVATGRSSRKDPRALSASACTWPSQGKQSASTKSDAPAKRTRQALPASRSTALERRERIGGR